MPDLVVFFNAGPGQKPEHPTNQRDVAERIDASGGSSRER